MFALMATTLFSYYNPDPDDWVDGTGGTVMTIADLQWLSDHSDVWDEDWVLGADIDAATSASWNSSTGIDPIGNAGTHFTGSFDGQGFTISNVTIDRSGKDTLGFFGYTDGAAITNLNLKDVIITGDYVLGGLIGYSNYSQIVNNTVSATLTGITSGNYGRVGGLIGSSNWSTVRYNRTTGTVTGNRYVGGVAGIAKESTVEMNYSLSIVSGVLFAGGLLGSSEGTVVQNNFSTGAIVVTDRDVGGLIGYCTNSTINKNYAAGEVIHAGSNYGGFIGENASSSSEISENYYDSEGANTTTGVGYGNEVGMVFGKTTLEFAAQSTFVDWDFDSVWELGVNPAIDAHTRPYFQTHKKDYFVSVYAITSLGGTLQGAGSHNSGDMVTLTAVPDYGYRFVEWKKSGVVVSTDSSYTFAFTDSHDITIMGLFTEDPQFDGGEGTSNNPYQISSIIQLKKLSNLPNLWDKHFVLVDDIDASETAIWVDDTNAVVGFRPIGEQDYSINEVRVPFTGSFDGAGHVIKDLFISQPNKHETGFFGYVEGGTLINIGFENAHITGGFYVGGLVGLIKDGSIQSSYSTGTFVSESGYSVGGLIGTAITSTITDCYSVSTVSDATRTGGFIGFNYGSSLSNSYSVGQVSSIVANSFVGSFAGMNSSYRSPGADNAIITFSYVDSIIEKSLTIASQNESADVRQLTTAEFLVNDSFPNFNFNDTWQIGTIADIDGEARPYLQWQLNGYDVAFTVAEYGTIFGATTQNIQEGNDAGSVTARANEGCYFVQWLDSDGANVTYDTTLSLTNIQESATFSAQFNTTYNKVTFYADTQSSITGIDSQHVNYGSDASPVEATLNEGYEFVAWLDSSGAVISEDNPVTISTVKEYTRLYASTQLIHSTVTFVAGDHGSVDVISITNIRYGAGTDSVTASPETGYQFDGWFTDGSILLSNENKFAFESIFYDSTITALFSIKQYTMLIQSESNGTISGDTLQVIDHAGSGDTVTARAEEGYSFNYWKNSTGDSVSIENPLPLESIINPDTLIATYTINSYTLDHSVGSGTGTITVDKSVANHGDSVTFTVTTALGYLLDSALVNGVIIPLDVTVDPGVYVKTISVQQAVMLTIYFSELPLSSSSYNSSAVSSAESRSSFQSSEALISSSLLSSSNIPDGASLSSSSEPIVLSSSNDMVVVSSSTTIAPIYETKRLRGAASAQLINMVDGSNQLNIPEHARSYTLYSIHGVVLYRGGVIESDALVLPENVSRGLMLIRFSE